MRSLRRTYALPREALQQFEQAVSADERSGVVAELLREWLDKRQRKRLRREVIEGCREMADVYLEIEREYHPLEEEAHHALSARPQTRRRRARTARPSGRL
ncbi:MAG: hypothetical protein FJ279_09780 [Planctomycetes bacterium]|nr:hypothetical protein [Planctomycetota bacterium]